MIEIDTYTSEPSRDYGFLPECNECEKRIPSGATMLSVGIETICVPCVPRLVARLLAVTNPVTSETVSNSRGGT